jgi:hypothetical protein
MKESDAVQVKAILDFICLESVRENTRTTTELTKLAQDENSILLSLTRKASRDTDRLKTFTMMTIICLPPALASVRISISILHFGTVVLTCSVVNNGHGIYRSEHESHIDIPYSRRILGFHLADGDITGGIDGHLLHLDKKKIYRKAEKKSERPNKPTIFLVGTGSGE